MNKNYALKSLLILTLILINLISINSQNINHWEMVVAAGDTWQYFPGISEPPSNWADNNFDASVWSSGPGGIGYGDDDDGTTINTVTSVYIRINFNLIDTSIISGAILNVDYDDGFVAYLNGHEIARSNIGTNGIRPSYSDLAASDHEAHNMLTGGIPDRFIIQSDIFKQYMIQGENVLALQVHNITEESSDLSSNAFLSVGIKDASVNYRQVPGWFIDPRNEKTNLPLLIIDTKGQEIVDQPKITASLKVINNGFGQMNGILDDGTDYDGNIGIEVRGQSSQMFPKKSFAVEVWTKAGLDTAVSLLGMPADEDWVLSAPYSDKTMLRNAITYHLGRKMGIWQPRYKYCEVYINGSYEGIYMLIEKIKRGSKRIDINKLKPDEIAGDDLTGGYIVKVDKLDGLTSDYDYFYTNPGNTYHDARNYAFSYVYPKAKDIVPQQKTYIQDYLLTLENTLNGSSFKDPNNGFRKYMDLNSFIDFEIINELSNNVDGYRYSTYFYKKRDSDGGKLYAGPIWDFDLGYGNLEYPPLNQATDQWLYPNYGPNEEYPMHWWARLMEDADYSKAFVDRWKALRAGPFKTDSIMAYLNDTIQYLGNAIDRNYNRWQIIGIWVWPNDFVGNTYQEDVDFLKTWINDRLTWMDANISLVNSINVVNYKGNYLSVYPIPVVNQMNIQIATMGTDKINIEIIDLLGKKVFSSEYSPPLTGKQNIQLKIPKLGQAVYTLKLIQKQKVIGTQKIIIKN